MRRAKVVAVRESKVEDCGGVVKFIGNALLEVAKAKRELEKQLK